MSRSRVPETDSIRELARFWEGHDLAGFEEDLQEAAEPVFEHQTVIPVHLEAKEAEALGRMAKAKGVEGEELIREWVLERIHAH